MLYPADNLPPIHPGIFLRDELETLDLSARRFAKHIHVPPNAVTAILNGDRSITAQWRSGWVRHSALRRNTG
jgi:antitoxin HigA-1